MSYNFDAAVSPFIKALPPSGLAKFLDIMAANPNIVPLSVGEPDFDIPQAVKDAEINSICEGKSCYTPTLGLWSCARQLRMISIKTTALNTILKPKSW